MPAPCSNCQSSGLPSQIYNLQYVYNNKCSSCDEPTCNGQFYDAKCVYYAGAALTCSGIATNDSLELALQKIDEQICSISGDYSTYNFHCIDDDDAITTEAQFVSAITDYVCTLNTTVNTFIDTTYVANQTIIDGRLDDVEVPGITCVIADVDDTDTLQEVLTKYCSHFGVIEDQLDISTVDWSQCFTVDPDPTSIAAGFDVLIDQICSIKADIDDAITTLPTFNNLDTCLADGGASDSLVDTIGKIKTRLCQTATFDFPSIDWDCLTGPSDTATPLDTTIQYIVDKLITISGVLPTFSEDFVVTAVDEDDPCLGVNVALATPLNLDRFVASNDADTDPGTLFDKLETGTNVTLDYGTPGKVIINATPSSDGKVYANDDDDTLGFLDEKVEGQDGECGMSILTQYNVSTKKVDITPVLDTAALLTCLFELIEGDNTLIQRLCSIVSECTPDDICSSYIISNESGPDGPGGTYWYTDCSRVVHTGTLAPLSDPIEVCAIGNGVTVVSLMVVDNGSCAGGTTTTTTTTTTTA